jgi:hypothetical protein
MHRLDDEEVPVNQAQEIRLVVDEQILDELAREIRPGDVAWERERERQRLNQMIEFMEAAERRRIPDDGN